MPSSQLPRSSRLYVNPTFSSGPFNYSWHFLKGCERLAIEIQSHLFIEPGELFLECQGGKSHKLGNPRLCIGYITLEQVCNLPFLILPLLIEDGRTYEGQTSGKGIGQEDRRRSWRRFWRAKRGKAPRQ